MQSSNMVGTTKVWVNSILRRISTMKERYQMGRRLTEFKTKQKKNQGVMKH